MRLVPERWPLVRAAIVLVAASVVSPCVVAAERLPLPVPTAAELQSVVGDLKTRLEISVPVNVSVVTKNTLMMSTEAPTGHRGAFQLKIDATFLARLTDEELEAAVAHELGHVWVFTHHPYMQTEALANQIAMRTVSRAALARVYEKVWKRGASSGDLAHVLGPEPTVTVGLAPEP
jgi:phosphoribosyl-AMP cyclohydrolase